VPRNTDIPNEKSPSEYDDNIILINLPGHVYDPNIEPEPEPEPDPEPPERILLGKLDEDDGPIGHILRLLKKYNIESLDKIYDDDII
jgi:hypothetical protein